MSNTDGFDEWFKQVCLPSDSYDAMNFWNYLRNIVSPDQTVVNSDGETQQEYVQTHDNEDSQQIDLDYHDVKPIPPA